MGARRGVPARATLLLERYPHVLVVIVVVDV
jgi:hypothetical protein